MTDPYAAFTSLTFERPAPGVLRIVLDAPNLNAVDPRMHGELADIWPVDRPGRGRPARCWSRAPGGRSRRAAPSTPSRP